MARIEMSDFGQRFLLARYPTGGVVVDLESGNYYRVNASAAFICDALLAGGDVEARVASELGVPRTAAARILAEVSAGLGSSAVRSTPQGSYHFHPTDGGYVLRHGERTVLEISSADLRIRLPAHGDPPGETQLELYVRALAPKLLFQRGMMVLHASTCVAAGRLIAFAGVSGAGKTTTVRAFVAAGARLVSEDLAVLAPKTRQPEVLTDAEPFIQVWARHVASRLLENRRGSVSPSELEGVVGGSTARLDRILFLDRSRRSGTELERRRIEGADALLTLMTHDFLGAKGAKEWRCFFESAVALIGAVQTEEISAPDGIERLAAAAVRYISRTAS